VQHGGGHHQPVEGAEKTFPQVAAAVRSGEVAGILPSYANRELPEPQYRRTHLPELATAATTLVLVWRDLFAVPRACICWADITVSLDDRTRWRAGLMQLTGQRFLGKFAEPDSGSSG
jgi:hypothetical protein